MKKFTVADAHCDSLIKVSELYESTGQFDIKRVQEYKSWLQFFAVCTDTTIGHEREKAQAWEIIEKFNEQIRYNSEHISHVKNISDIHAAFDSGKIAALLALEGGGAIGIDIRNVQKLYDAGVRLITLTWNAENTIATGAGVNNPTHGLTEFGRLVVAEMNRLGMIVDVSHLSEKSFWDVAEVCEGAFIASHSNSKHICNHVRNLTDEQFLEIVRVGGVAGMNFYTLFVNGTNKAKIDDMMKHIDHFLALGGEDSIALGSDFDGIDTCLSDLKGAEDMHKLFTRMSKAGYSDELIGKIAAENLLRVVSTL